MMGEPTSGKWLKYPIGKIHGHSVYVELPADYTGGQIETEWHRASALFEKLFRQHDFITQLKEIINEE